MNKARKRILKCLYDLNKARNSISRSLNDINTNTGIDTRIIDRETDYLKQKGYIEKNLITTTNISAYAFRITAQGIDIVESKFFKSAYLKILIWFLIVGIPTLIFYLDLFGIRKKITGNSFQNTEVQNIIGGEGTNIQALKAGRDINISINPGLKEKAKLSIADIPFIFAEPAEFIIYKPLDSKTPGQEKVWIKIKLTNQSAYYAYNIHINFLTEDGTGHKTNSDLWNEEMGTKSLYTFNSIGPSDKKYAAWRPDVPSNYEQLLKSGKAMFKLVIYVKWKDMQNKEYDFLILSELRYNKELDTFVFEVKENYNSLNDRAKIDFVLNEFEKIEKM